MEVSWEVMLNIGASANGNAESVYRRALAQAEKDYGPESPTAGICLIELADCLERNGKSLEAEIFTDRYRAILCRFAKEIGLGTPPKV